MYRVLFVTQSLDVNRGTCWKPLPMGWGAGEYTDQTVKAVGVVMLRVL